MNVLSIPILLLAAAMAPAWCANEKKKDAPIKLPVYRCQHIDGEITLTGKFDDPLWRKAAVVDMVDCPTGERKGVSTKARLLWNDKCLYVGFECVDTDIHATFTKRDDPVYNEDAVELFVCPTGKIRQYYEIELSPLNTIFDGFILNGRVIEKRNWEDFHLFTEYNFAGMNSKVAVNGVLNTVDGAKGWTAEMAIPLAAFIGNEALLPVKGDRWRINLYRLDVVTKEQTDLYAWSPTMLREFHCPQQFGYLEFCR